MSEELARRAVACKGWRWLSGMRAVGRRNLPAAWFRAEESTPALTGEWSGALPDLTDPATLGCLLVLVRQAWGDPRAYLCDYGGYDSVEWGVVSHEWDAKRQAEGPKAWFSCLLGDADTEAGALVAALEAAP
jgi:hypothetical protein